MKKLPVSKKIGRAISATSKNPSNSRRSAASSHVGVPETHRAEVMERVGQRTEKSTKVYCHTSLRDFRSKLAKLPAMATGAIPPPQIEKPCPSLSAFLSSEIKNWIARVRSLSMNGPLESMTLEQELDTLQKLLHESQNKGAL